MGTKSRGPRGCPTYMGGKHHRQSKVPDPTMYHKDNYCRTFEASVYINGFKKILSHKTPPPTPPSRYTYKQETSISKNYLKHHNTLPGSFRGAQ